MCHRSQAADGKIKDLTQVYDEGDLVKAVVLKVKYDCCYCMASITGIGCL